MNTTLTTLNQAIEHHEAFKKEVSDAVKELINGRGPHIDIVIILEFLDRFIINSDPLADILCKLELSGNRDDGEYDARWIRAELEERGLEIREKQP
jgi:hypothetical protein